MNMQQLAAGIYRLPGSVFGGVLVQDGHALLIDAPEQPAPGSLPDLLCAAGVGTVDGVLLTQHRRAFSGGLLQWSGPLPPVRATPPEAALLRAAGKVWRSSHGKYHRYEALPDRFLPLESIAACPSVGDGAAFSWRGFSITPVVAAGQSDGDCCYVVRGEDGVSVAFCGAAAMAGGRIHDLYSFQKALPGMMGYHGYLGGLVNWLAGMERLLALRPGLLSPAWGGTDPDPAGCILLLRRRLLDYARAYARISAVRYYFPAEFRAGFEEKIGFAPPAEHARPAAHPPWLRRIGETTSYLLTAPSGHALLIDAGDASAVEAVLAMVRAGELAGLDACWITHAHDDHLNAVWDLTHNFDCEILSTAAVAEVCSQPSAWFLPALPDCNVRFRVLDDGESWQWEGFRLTALHFPGQMLYHSGLLAERDGRKVLLCGDSFAPTGLDDYCADNRNLPGDGRGYRRCLELLRRYGVCQLVNQHQTEPFCYDEAYLAFLERGMDLRDACLRELLPDDIGLGLDSQWLRVWPMEQEVSQGAFLRLTVQVTGHGRHMVRVAPRLPWAPEQGAAKALATSGPTSGSVRVSSGQIGADGRLPFDILLPEGLTGDFSIPFDCWLDGAFLGSFVTAQVHIVP